MGLRSAWAYHNGRRIMNEALDSIRDEKTGWLTKDGNIYYAERYEPTGKLMIKTHANLKQARKTSEKLHDLGFCVVISLTHPFTIIKIS